MVGSSSIHMPNIHQAQFWTPDLSSTSGSSVNQCSCSRSPKVGPTACTPSVPVAPNGELIRHPQAETPGVAVWKIPQGTNMSVHQLRQPQTDRAHLAPVWFPWDNITHINWRKWTKNESIMVSPRPNGRPIWENWERSGFCGSCKYPNPRGEISQYHLITDPQNWGNGKILWAVGRHAG